MTRSVWKYFMEWEEGPQVIVMPTGALFLDCQLNRGDLTLWALVDPTAPRAPRTFQLFCTGHDFAFDPNRMVYRGTVQRLTCVWHLFETTT